MNQIDGPSRHEEIALRSSPPPSAALPLNGAGQPDEVRFLRGSQSRGFEFGKALAILYEMLRGFRTFHFLGPCVTVFGSARLDEADSHYSVAREIGSRLAQAGFTVMTGGGA